MVTEQYPAGLGRTVEMILFEILGRAGTPDFKRVADILKE